MNRAEARLALALAAQRHMTSDRFKYDVQAVADVLALVELGKVFGGRDVGTTIDGGPMSQEELDAAVAAVLG